MPAAMPMGMTDPGAITYAIKIFTDLNLTDQYSTTPFTIFAPSDMVRESLKQIQMCKLRCTCGASCTSVSILSASTLSEVQGAVTLFSTCTDVISLCSFTTLLLTYTLDVGCFGIEQDTGINAASKSCDSFHHEGSECHLLGARNKRYLQSDNASQQEVEAGKPHSPLSACVVSYVYTGL